MSDEQSWGDTTNPIIAEANNAPLATSATTRKLPSTRDGRRRPVSFLIPAPLWTRRPHGPREAQTRSQHSTSIAPLL